MANVSGLVNKKASGQFVIDLLIKRALGKFRHMSRASILREAKDALVGAGNWHDDVRIEVMLAGGNRDGRCSRLLHGVPSPRFWKINRVQYAMPAIDIVYFFAETDRERDSLLSETLPPLVDPDSLAAWLAGFSSRRFHKGLVQALVKEAQRRIDTMARYRTSFSQGLEELSYREVALIAAEIDRYAWHRGFSSMNLAKAAPVWEPTAEQSSPPRDRLQSEP